MTDVTVSDALVDVMTKLGSGRWRKMESRFDEDFIEVSLAFGTLKDYDKTGLMRLRHDCYTFLFLVADTQLYNRFCPSVRP